PEQLHRRLPHRIRDHPWLSHLQACWICLGSGWACIKIPSLSRWRNFAPAYCLGSLAMRPAVLGCLAALCAASAARAAVVADCNQVRDAQLRLRACSATALTKRRSPIAIALMPAPRRAPMPRHWLISIGPSACARRGPDGAPYGERSAASGGARCSPWNCAGKEVSYSAGMEKQPKYVARIDNIYFINRIGTSLREATSNVTTAELPENIRLLLRRLKRMKDRANSRTAE